MVNLNLFEMFHSSRYDQISPREYKKFLKVIYVHLYSGIDLKFSYSGS